MGAKGAKTPTSGQPSAYRSLRMSSSSLGQALPLAYGETRVAHNLVWAKWFTAIKNATPTSAKAGGLTTAFQFTYTVSAILALAEGAMPGDGNIFHIGRATPGAQVMNVGDTSGKEVKPQPSEGIDPGVWKAKRVRTLDERGTVSHKPFKSMHFHDWDPTAGWPDGTRFVTMPGDVIGDAFTDKRNQFDPTGHIQKQKTNYLALTNEQYPGVAAMVIQNMQLGSNASIPNLNYPLRGLEQYVNRYGLTPGSGRAIHDCDPACIIFDLLTNEKHGAGWDKAAYKLLLAGFVDDAHPYAWGQRIAGSALTAPPVGLPADNSFSAYCRANNILFSPLYDQQQTTAQILQDLAQATNSALVWSEGQFKIIPYGDQVVVNAELGVTYTPVTDPAVYTLGAHIGVQYDLGLDDYQPGNGQPTVLVERQSVVPDNDSAGLFNDIRIEWLDAANAYATEVAEIRDEASISMYGILTQDPYTMHQITNPDLATDVAIRMLMRLVTVRSTYKFTLGWRFCLLEPMDVVTLTDPMLGLDHRRVRLTVVEETETGLLNCEAEDYPNDFGGGTLPPVIVNPPAEPDGGDIVFGGIWTIIQRTLDNPYYQDLTGGMADDTSGGSSDLATRFVTDDVTITSWVVTYTRQMQPQAETASPLSPAYIPATARLRFAVDGVSRPEFEITFAYAEKGATKLAYGSLNVPPGSVVSVEVAYFDDGGNLMPTYDQCFTHTDDALGTVTTKLNGKKTYCQQAFNWSVGIDPNDT